MEMTTRKVQGELSVVISAGSSLLLVLHGIMRTRWLRNKQNRQQPWKWAQSLQLRLSLFFIFKSCFSPLAGQRLGTGRGHGLSSRGIKLMTGHATVETASWLFNILRSEAILKLPYWNDAACGRLRMNPLPVLSPLKLMHYLLWGCHRRRKREDEHKASFSPPCQWECLVGSSSSAPLF